MKRFKFRAKLSEVEHGGYCYGYVVYRYGKVFIEDAVTHEVHTVEEENVDQLVCYDAEGNEVYEGDDLIGKDKSQINPRYVGIIDLDSNAIDGEIGCQFDDVWLKKGKD